MAPTLKKVTLSQDNILEDKRFWELSQIFLSQENLSWSGISTLSEKIVVFKKILNQKYLLSD